MNEQCEHEGCERDGFPCHLDDDPPDDPNGYFCAEHALENGFRYVCGWFSSGCESFDFGPGSCDNCRSQVEEDERDDETPWDDFDDPWAHEDEELAG